MKTKKKNLKKSKKENIKLPNKTYNNKTRSALLHTLK